MEENKPSIAEAYRDFIKWKLCQFGPGRKHSLKKKLGRLTYLQTKWDHVDPNYGEKLATAMIRICDLKRAANE